MDHDCLCGGIHRHRVDAVVSHHRRRPQTGNAFGIRDLCLIVAGMEFLWLPFGTVLGVCTFIGLFRPEVSLLFREATSTRETFGPTDEF